MKSRALKPFWDCFDALPSDVQALAREAFALWQDNPRHPSLHFKRVHSDAPLCSVRIGKYWRALGFREGDTVTWFWIGKHAEYDKRLARL